MFDVAKLFAKLPGFVFTYPDCFLGLFCVMIGLPQGVNPGNAFLPFGFALIVASMVRRNWHTIGSARRTFSDYSPRYKLTLIYTNIVASVFWLVLLWGCSRWWALDVQIKEPLVRWIFRY